jgi:hypothetical protein
MSNLKTALLSCFALIGLSTSALSQGTNPTAVLSPMPGQKSTPASTQLSVPLGSRPSFDQVVDRVVDQEHFFLEQMGHLHPLVETYIQNLKSDPEMGAVPVSDQYFFGRLDRADGTQDRSFMRQPGFAHRVLSSLSRIYDTRFLPLGFAQMVVLDDDFQRKYYSFTFVRREFLGEVRCLVIDVQPKKHSGNGRFVGRIWVEDQDYNIVRFNGTYTPPPLNRFYLHFDSWRLNLRPGIWLPAYIYSEESGPNTQMSQNLYFKAQTRLWGYDLQHLVHNGEFAEILVDAPQTVRDQSDSAQDPSPLESQRIWERQAEDNAAERLQKAGLIAPPGEVDQVLQTVVNNLVVTNNLEIQPEVRVRVLLTTPLESFTIGHTIVVSRGLLDVLPDEAALAMVMAHELSHIALGHRLDTELAFNDRLFFPDEKTFQRLNFARSPADEEAADTKAVELLAHSPYKDQLSNAGLFLRALQARAPELKNLIRPHVGNPLAKGAAVRMSALLNSAPQLEMRRTDQITALPLGGRIKLDPWSNRIEMVKTKPVAPISAREKMPFEVTPFFPYLTRLSGNTPDNVALTSPVR